MNSTGTACSAAGTPLSGCRATNMQDYLVRRADRHSIPKVDNTNVDRSVATIHATLTGALRRREQVQHTICEAAFKP